jgi:ribosomal protein S6--L-glutamate ligase
MRIGILSRNKQLYSTQRLVEAALSRGHEPQVVDTVRAAVQLSIAPASLRNPTKLPPFDAVIPRIGASVTRYGLAVVGHYERQGAVLTANEEGLAQSRDKHLSHRALEAAGLPVPNTVFVAHPRKLWDAIEEVGGLPVVLKRRQSTQGRGVMLLTNLQTTRHIIRTMERQRVPVSLLVQAFIPEADGKDLRIIVVGDRCVAAMERAASEGDFRSNLHRGGTATSVALSTDESDIALKAAHALSLAVGGIDLIKSNSGVLVLEANSSPGLEGIEGSTGLDVAGSIIDYLETEHQRQSKPLTRPLQDSLRSAPA